MLAIGYDGDTTETDEKPSLYGFRNGLEISGDNAEIHFALMETVKPTGDCLDCELRDEREELQFSEVYADVRRY